MMSLTPSPAAGGRHPLGGVGPGRGARGHGHGGGGGGGRGHRGGGRGRGPGGLGRGQVEEVEHRVHPGHLLVTWGRN